MHINVMLEYFYPWTNSAGIYLARKEGWYDEVGLDVECRTYDPLRGDSISYLIRGEVDFAIFPSNRLFVRHEQGAQIQGIAAINHRGMEVIQTVKGRGITRPRDLSGKRIALNPTPRGLAMVRHIIKKDGGDPHFKVVDSGTRELTPEDIANNVADATFGSYWAWEVLFESAIPHDERIIWPVDKIGAPLYHSYLMGSNLRFMQKNPNVVKAFLAATQKGYLAVIKNPKAVAPIYEDILPYFPPTIIERSLPLIAKSWTHDGMWGIQRRELLEPYARWLKANGILSDPDIWRDAINNTYLPGGETDLSTSYKIDVYA